MAVATQSTVSDPAALHAEVARLQALLAEREQRESEQRQRLEQAEQAHAEQQQRLAERDQRIEQLLDLIAILKRKRFGPSADRLNLNALQGNLFDEAELEALLGELQAELDATQGQEEAPAPAPSEPAASKQRPKRQALPAHLPRVERIIDLDEAQKAALGDDWVLIGYEEAEQLAMIPRQFYVIVTKRAKYAPLNDQVPGAERGLIVAARGPQLLPKAIAHSSLLAEVVASKFIDALPLYRQQKRFEAEGIHVPRQSMAGWLIATAERLDPLMAAIKRQLQRGEVLHIDETRLQVLDEPGRADTQQSYMWVYCGGPRAGPVVWFDYSERRAATVPKQFLFGEPSDEAEAQSDAYATVTLISDGYSVYHVLAREPAIGAHAACWAHVRRKFVEAAEGRKHSAPAHQIVALIAQLYAVERRVRDAAPEQRLAERQQRSRLIIDKIETWLDKHAQRTLPKSALGGAIAYARNLWPQLTVFLDDGQVPLDNNRAENAIRPFVIGRKNFLFSGSPRGAQASATLYSLIETAKANGHEPRAYLHHLFEQLPLARTQDSIDALLPWAIKPEDIPALRQAP